MTMEGKPEGKKRPKNPTYQRAYHKKGKKELIESVPFNTGPDNQIVLYFAGRSDGKRVKVGIGKDIQNAVSRVATHSREAAQHGLSYKLLAAVRALPDDEAFLKKLWHHKCPVKSNTEIWEADEEVRGWLRFLRQHQHVALHEVTELNRKEFVPSSLWMPCDGRSTQYDDEIVQLSLLDTAIGSEKDPFDDVLQFIYRPDNDYFTPECLIESTKVVFGGFIDLDPASCEWANRGDKEHKGVEARHYFTALEDGLKQSWRVIKGRGSRVWLNPPFTQWKKWSKKLLDEFQSGNAEHIIVYCTFQTATTKTFNTVLQKASAILITNGRIDCWGPNATSSNGDGNLVAYLGPEPQRFCREFSKHGTTWILPKYETVNAP